MSVTTIVAVSSQLVGMVNNFHNLMNKKGLRRQDSTTKEEFDKLAKKLLEYQKKLAELAEQLNVSESLTRLIPGWQTHLSNFPLSKRAADITDTEIDTLHKELTSLIQDAITNGIVAQDYRTKFQLLPRMSEPLISFNETVSKIDKILTSVKPPRYASFRERWPDLQTFLSSVQDDTIDIQRLAVQAHRQLLDDLKKAAAEQDFDLAQNLESPGGGQSSV